MWHVGIDTGGTFTDLYARDQNGLTRLVKVPSTPPHFEDGILTALDQLGIPLQDVALLAHGTTVGTNALIMRDGPEAALITTEGFRDVLELRRHNREDLYDIFWDPPEPLIRRTNRFGIRERIDYAGTIIEPLDIDGLHKLAHLLQMRDVKAVAVVFLHSYQNPEHEQRAKELLQKSLPDDVYISISSDLIRETHEFERTSTTAVNAYLGPVFSRYIAKLHQVLGERGLRQPLLLSHSGGGLQPADSMIDRPARTVNSGPAAGVLGAAATARRAGRQKIISIDMGGTSADIAVVVDGSVGTVPEFSPQFGMPIRFPSVDLTALGAGGGSIAWVDAAGYPKVGPHSAGAAPGPAAYGLGGSDVTITDANLVLGRLSPDTKLAGTLSLNLAAAQRAVNRFAASLGLPDLDAAAGILRIALGNMNQGIRLMTVRRGLDPREFSLLAFGGAGPMHAVELARAASIPEVLVPPHPGVLSAIGLLYGDIVHDYVQTAVMLVQQAAMPVVEAHFSRMEHEASEALERDGVEAARRLVQRTVDIRYVGQTKALSIPVPPEVFSLGVLKEAAARFYAEYDRRFRFSPRDIPLEVAALRVQGRGLQMGAEADPPTQVARGGNNRATAKRPVYFDGEVMNTPVYERSALVPRSAVSGPAIIEQLDTTTVVPPGALARVDPNANLIIHVGLSHG